MFYLQNKFQRLIFSVQKRDLETTDGWGLVYKEEPKMEKREIRGDAAHEAEQPTAVSSETGSSTRSEDWSLHISSDTIPATAINSTLENAACDTELSCRAISSTYIGVLYT